MIKQANFDDIAGIYKLLKEYPDVVLPRAPSDIVQNLDRFFVFKRGTRLLGVVSYKILPEMGLERVHCVEIVSLAVQQKAQSSGIGSALVKHVLKHLRSFKNTRIITLTFTPDFFKKLGFVRISKKKIMNKLYLGCIHCAKYDSPMDCPEVAMEFKK